jgi:hypothetical protein
MFFTRWLRGSLQRAPIGATDLVERIVVGQALRVNPMR